MQLLLVSLDPPHETMKFRTVRVVYGPLKNVAEVEQAIRNEGPETEVALVAGIILKGADLWGKTLPELLGASFKFE